ncbi:MAG: hypothetical protein ACFFBD_14655 [Candidatus Hodarchaeota archaeon]
MMWINKVLKKIGSKGRSLQKQSLETDVYIFIVIQISLILFLPEIGNWQLRDTLVPAIFTQSDLVDFFWITKMVGVVLIACYIIVALYVPKSPLQRRTKLFLIILTSIFFVLIPCFSEIALRLKYGPGTWAHDGGVLQTEEAMKCLLRGQNPYVEEYVNTPMIEYWAENPALYHLPYLPAFFLISLPVYSICSSIIGFYDQRIVYIIFYYFSFLLFGYLGEEETKPQTLLLALLNPWITSFIIEGRNDIFIILILLLIILLERKGYPHCAALMLGVGLAAKLTIWPIMPFYCLYRLKHIFPIREGDKRTIIKELSILMLVFLVFCLITLPFFLWDPTAFIDDIFLFNSGLTEYPFPIRGNAGYGFASIVLFFGLVSSTSDYFPFWIFQLLFGIIPLYFGLKKVYLIENKKFWPTILFYYCCLTFILLFFGRFFHDNYIGYLFAILVLSENLKSNFIIEETK